MSKLVDKLKNKAAQFRVKAKEKAERLAQEELEKETNANEVNWNRFLKSYEEKLEHAADLGKYSETIYYLCKYDIAPGESLQSYFTPDITENNIRGAAKKIFNHCIEQGLNPKIEISSSILKVDTEGGMDYNTYYVSIVVSWVK